MERQEAIVKFKQFIEASVKIISYDQQSHRGFLREFVKQLRHLISIRRSKLDKLALKVITSEKTF